MKRILLLATACLFTAGAFSQTFRHGAGLGYSVDKVELTDARVGVYFIYAPRIDFLENDRTSLSVAVPLTVGGSFSYDYYYDGSYGTLYDDYTVNFYTNIPVMFNVNFGAGSSKANRSRFGGYIGGGFGYNYNASTDDAIYDEYGNAELINTGGSTFGPAANGGFRIRTGRQSKNIEIRMYYFRGLSSARLNLFQLGCLFNF
ncbi:hypothetical protein [Chitinophaga cymbidii]|uniref:Outer membrane protein beta-barrel domain-containing protein n=1 Tax=Chitinophaga cymbidii TaxID=1096750 RepID=A0A512RMB2_9BACT|nr:hypothetical protein [Chitinophaga cymbidii]GEP96844.1 hypothetical protein CCY01nite_31040 [Chitinophaga cymbidii]